MNWTPISNSKLLCSVGEWCIYYKKGGLYIQESHSSRIRKLLYLPNNWWKKIVVRSRLLERLFRLEPRIAIALNEREFLLSYQGEIFRINCANGSWDVEHHYRKGMNNPLGFCTCEGEYLYGEYFGNSGHEEVCIYKRQEECNWKKVFTFRAGTVEHIHRIVPDQYRKCVWILTGDNNQESGIWKADLDFHNVEPVFIGEQRYRSCFLLPLQEGILYATDTPLEDNGIYFSQQTDGGRFREPELIYSMPGPCIYGIKMHDDMVAMATSVEPDASLPTWRYRVTSMLGKGVKDQYSHLIVGNLDIGFQELYRFKKDRYGMWLFQFGNLMFPNVNCRDELFVTGQALDEIDGKTICFRF